MMNEWMDGGDGMGEGGGGGHVCGFYFLMKGAHQKVRMSVKDTGVLRERREDRRASRIFSTSADIKAGSLFISPLLYFPSLRPETALSVPAT